MIKPLDIVETPKGGLAIVVEMSPAGTNMKINTYSINYLKDKNPGHEHNAWWQEDQLKYIDSIPVLIAKAMCHPFGENDRYVESIFNNKL